jgi:copper homeostasis protein
VRRVLLEVCVDSANGLEAAIAGGADRIELCSALELGGLTPSPGLIAIAAAAPIPVYAMIRPRAGRFIFSEAELDQMHQDIDAVRTAALAGVVLGVSKESGALDEAALSRLAEQASGLGTTLHRAVDLAPDLLAAVDLAISLKFERILSSGGRKTALEGVEGLASMIEQAAGRISIMPGSGVNSGNAAALLARLDVTEAHGSCSVEVVETDARALAFGFSTGQRRVTSTAQVAALRAALNQEYRMTSQASTK